MRHPPLTHSHRQPRASVNYHHHRGMRLFMGLICDEGVDIQNVRVAAKAKIHPRVNSPGSLSCDTHKAIIDSETEINHSSKVSIILPGRIIDGEPASWY